jgi:hypothetical protein
MTAPFRLDTPADATPGPLSRRSAIRRLGFLGGWLSLGALPLALTTWRGRAEASATRSQTTNDILNFLLAQEWMLASFYNEGLVMADFIPLADRTVFTQLLKQEGEHVQLWEETLGPNALPKPLWDFTAAGAYPDVFTSYGTFLAMAQCFEDLGVRAYQSQTPALLAEPAMAAIALRILAVEGRHASEVRRVRGLKGWVTLGNAEGTPFAAAYAGEENHVQSGVDMGNTAAATEAFDEPLSMSNVLAITDRFIVLA